MTQTNTPSTDVASTDVLNSLLGIDEGSSLGALRAERSAATEHTQGSYAALFSDNPRTAVTPLERFAIALRVAALHEESTLVDHYRTRLRSTPGTTEELIAAVLTDATAGAIPARLRAGLTHAELLVIRPAAATPADLTALQSAGLSDPEIVTVSQLIAFVSFQVRLVVGFRLLRGDQRDAPAATIGPRDATTAGFTQAELGWSPWIVPFEAAEATEEQRAVLPGQRIDSPYFRLLALDPPVLGERTATDMGIFYTQGGLPRPDRELAATVTSRINGCIYCASVHSRRAAQLSGRTDDIQRLLDEGVSATLDDRWRAISDLSAALTMTPPTPTQAHVDRLRDLGLSDLEILDVIQSAAFFAWANRLMLTLGEPIQHADT